MSCAAAATLLRRRVSAPYPALQSGVSPRMGHPLGGGEGGGVGGARDVAHSASRGARLEASAPEIVQQARLMDSAGTAWHAVKCGNLEVRQCGAGGAGRGGGGGAQGGGEGSDCARRCMHWHASSIACPSHAPAAPS